MTGKLTSAAKPPPPTGLFYVGVAIILGAVFAHPFLERPGRVEHAEVLATAEAKHLSD